MVLGKSHRKVQLIRTCWVNLITCSTCHFLHMPLSINKTLRFASPKTHVSRSLVFIFKTPHSLSCLLLLLQPNTISGGYSINGDQSPDSFRRPDCNPDVDYGTTFTLQLLLRLVASHDFHFFTFLSKQLKKFR